MYYYLTIMVRIDPNLVAYSTDIAWVHFLQATSYNDDGEPMCLKGNSTSGSQRIQPSTYTLHCTVVFNWDKYMITNGIWQINQHKHMKMGKKADNNGKGCYLRPKWVSCAHKIPYIVNYTVHYVP